MRSLASDLTVSREGLREWRAFIAELTDLALVQAIHDLRAHREDKPYLDEALVELANRSRVG